MKSVGQTKTIDSIEIPIVHVSDTAASISEHLIAHAISKRYVSHIVISFHHESTFLCIMFYLA